MSDLPETINEIKSLEKLYLNQNELSIVNLNLNQLKRLMLVDLHENTVPVGTMGHLERTGVRIRF
jgi:Leucine-rich repeat (LRR) protein